MIRRASVLVVDDNELNRDALSRLLLQKGYDALLAANGEQALEIAGSRDFDLILLDIGMPGMSGLDVLKRLRETHSRIDLPIIMVTARSRGADVVEALGLGANDYVTKPVDFAVALARIETHVSHKWAVESLRESEERYALAVQGANDGLWDWNLTTNEVHWSPRWKAMLGYGPSEIGTSLDEWVTRVHRDDVGRVKDALDLHLAGGGSHYESEHRILHRDQTYRWVRCRGAAIRNAAGIATRLAGSLTDVTDSKVADALTGLPNRVLLVELLEHAIRRRQRRPDYTCALLILGLDRFSAMNDSLGLLTADRLLVAVARRLQANLRELENDTSREHGFTIARLGGDEFTVLLDDIRDAADAIRVAEKLQAGMQKAFDVDGQHVFTSVAVGIAVGAASHHRPEDILRDAAIALHRAKADGSNCCAIFDPAMREGAVSRLQAETNLRHAIQTGAFVVHYQPIVSLRDGTIVSFEALARWRHPSRGIVAAAEFIPLAEDTGMLLEIDRITLVESCRQMAAWQRRLGPAAPHAISVNVSSLRFRQGDLVSDIKAVLRDTGLEPSRLTLEITERAVIGDLSAAQLTLSGLSAIGVQWSLDDFGTGYSSLSYLHRLHVDTLKLDRSFVSRIGLEHAGSEMVRAIVTLAHTLQIDVVGEGVETPEQLAALGEFGCDYAQGFLFSRALDAAGADRLIAEQPWKMKSLVSADVVASQAVRNRRTPFGWSLEDLPRPISRNDVE
jgi:diguanylate cyclase (GGDEF)-like protein/PAS domain S-box-containing protein